MVEVEPLFKSLRPDYERHAATKDVNLFVGWDYMLDLAKQVEAVVIKLRRERAEWEEKVKQLKRENPGKWFRADRPPRELPGSTDEESVAIHQGAIALFFLTGCRAREILGIKEKKEVPVYKGKRKKKLVKTIVTEEWLIKPLRATNFRLDLDPRYVYVEGCPVLKRYKKIDYDVVRTNEPDHVAPSHSALWHFDREERVFERRKWMTKRLFCYRTFYFRKDEPLVPYLMKLIDLRKNEESLLPGKYYYWYWFMRQLDPMKEKYGARVRWKWIYPHWFRAQRVSQLAVDYDLSLHEISQWGEWKSIEVVNAYVGLTGVIKQKMDRGRPQFSP